MIAALLLQLLSTFGPPSPRGQAAPPSVLIIIADDLGLEPAGGGWGYIPPNMPNLQDLADQGMAFSQARVEPVCSTTRFALFWGRYSRRANIWRSGVDHLIGFGDVSTDPENVDGDRVALPLFSLPEILEPQHRTALIGKWHLGLAPGSDLLSFAPRAHGFDRWIAGNPTAPAWGAADGYYDWLRVDDCSSGISSVYATAAQRDALLEWWGDTPGAKFAVFAASDPHEPVVDDFNGVNNPPGYAGSTSPRQAYGRHRSYLDDVIGEVMAEVSLTDTVVVFLGDNGVFNAGRPIGSPSGVWKGSTYEGGIRVPFVIAGPGISVGVSDRLVHAVDLPSTLIEIAGACPLEGFEDSLSFADELGSWNGAAPREFLFSERYETFAGSGVQPDGYDDLAIVEQETQFVGITARWKYRKWDPDGNGVGGFQEALYQLNADPYELNPIAINAPGVGAVYTRLSGYLASLPARAQ